jgi:hypothetical protein
MNHEEMDSVRTSGRLTIVNESNYRNRPTNQEIRAALDALTTSR